MKFKKYLTEAKATKAVKKQVEEWLKLDPDIILYNMKRINKTKDAEFLIGLIQKPQDTVSIMKHTIEGNIGIQLYMDKNKIKVDEMTP